MNMILETSRLILRRQVPDDLDDLWALYSDPMFTKFIPDAPRSREEAKEELEWHMNGHPQNRSFGLWATIHKETGEFIGRCGLLPWNINAQDEVEVAYGIGRPYWGQGLGTEAAKAILEYGFFCLNVPRLISLIDSENVASQKVAEKIGMAFEKEGRDKLGAFLVYSKERQNDG
jgi:RimJ/RimL family protein N-acetyltransferase